MSRESCRRIGFVCNCDPRQRQGYSLNIVPSKEHPCPCLNVVLGYGDNVGVGKRQIVDRIDRYNDGRSVIANQTWVRQAIRKRVRAKEVRIRRVHERTIQAQNQRSILGCGHRLNASKERIFVKYSTVDSRCVHVCVVEKNAICSRYGQYEIFIDTILGKLGRIGIVNSYRWNASHNFDDVILYFTADSQSCSKCSASSTKAKSGCCVSDQRRCRSANQECT